jgi:hypothetical protein
MSAPQPFNWSGMLARLLFSFLLVFSVYNPSGVSYWHWLVSGSGPAWALVAAGGALLTVLIFITRITRRVLRVMYTVLLTVTVGAIYAGIGMSGVVNPWAGDTIAVGVLSLVAVLYASGLSYSLIQHRLAGIVHARPLLE